MPDASVHGYVYLWPDNEPSWGAWLLVQGRWRYRAEGAEQLDMAGCAVLLRASGYRWRKGAGSRQKPDDLHRVLVDLSIMESEFLHVLASKRGRNKARR